MKIEFKTLSGFRALVAIFAVVALVGCAVGDPFGELAKKHPTMDLKSEQITSQVKQVSHAQPVQPATHEALITLNPSDSLLKIVDLAPGNVLLDFHAEWCGPCKKQGRVLEELQQSARAAKATIVKIDVEEHPELTQQFKVAALPTLILVKDRTVAQRLMGFTDAKRIESLLSQ